MDGTASREEKAPTPTTGDAASSVDVEQKQALPAGVPSDDAAAEKVGSGGEGEEDDEQVDKFFALLANIRALRRMYGVASFTGDGAAVRGRKRAREAEPPWRPAFRMEDFETEEQSAGKKKKKMEGMCGGARRLAVTSTGADDDGEVVGPSGRPIDGRVAGRG